MHELTIFVIVVVGGLFCWLMSTRTTIYMDELEEAIRQEEIAEELRRCAPLVRNYRESSKYRKRRDTANRDRSPRV